MSLIESISKTASGSDFFFRHVGERTCHFRSPTIFFTRLGRVGDIDCAELVLPSKKSLHKCGKFRFWSDQDFFATLVHFILIRVIVLEILKQPI